jgi:hypothetical protein
MTAIDIEKTMLLHLMACNVPESAIKIVRAQNKDIMTLTVTAPHGLLKRQYPMSHFVADKVYTIVSEMVELADWYHGNEGIQVRQTSWDYIVGCWTATPRFMRIGLTVIVIALIAKMAGLYQ